MIGVCLKFEQKNYGSKLQALATIKKLNDLGLQYEIIHYRKGIWFKVKSLPRLFNKVFLNDWYDAWQKKISFKIHSDIKPLVETRNEAFEKYDELYFNKYQIIAHGYKDLKNKAQKYSAVITCSDQLWSPSGLGSNFYNLMFVPNNIKKISFASSFGVSQIPWYQKRRTRKYLKRIEHISVRENRGKEIVKELTGRDVPVLMDPVFAYDKYEWENIIPNEKIYDFPYILCYFLGNNINYRKSVEKLAKEKGLKIIALNFLDRYVKYDKGYADHTPFNINPSQFLNILRNAEYICTDSFHGCAFAIINEKRFVVFNRYRDTSSVSKNSRIDTVCDNLGLHDRHVNADIDLISMIDNPIDYNKIFQKLKFFINQTDIFLKEAFKEIQ